MEYEMKCMAGKEPRILVTREFVERNHLSINLQAAEEIMASNDGFLNFAHEVAYLFLPFDKAKEFMKPEFIPEFENGNKEFNYVIDVMEAAQDFLDYMVFAWMKAMDQRGISAERSVMKLAAWMKILSRPDVAELLERYDLYPMYGRPALKAACKELGIDHPYYL